MIRLDTVNRSLAMYLGGAQATAPLQAVVSYSDQTATTYLGGTKLTNSNGTTAVTICSAPAASTIRDIDMVTILNTDTVSQVVTVEMLDTATPYLISTVTLLVGEKLTYTHGSAWQVVDNSGNVKYVVLSTSGVNSFSGGSTGLTPATATTGAVTLGGTLAVASGGTGTASPSLVAGTNVTITGTWPNQTVNASSSGTVSSVAATVPSFLTVTGSPITTSGTLAISYSGTALPIANGGTGQITAAAAITALTGTQVSGRYLRSDGTNATLAAIVAADVPTLNQNTTGTAANVTGVVAVANGGTNATTASAARTSLGAAASGANTDITSVALTTGTISTAPSASTDIVNKSYADSIATGVNFHAACNLATTAALPANTYNNGTGGVGATLTATANAALVVDSVTVTSGQRILVKNEVAGANNGVYTVTQVGSGALPYILTRATDYDTSGTGTNEIDIGDLLLVISGTVNANTSWVQQTPLPITVGTTALVFIQFAAVQTYTAGTGLTLATNQFSITNTGTAGTYGSASQVPVFVTNAQGQVTSVTNTAIAISGSAVSGNITGTAANVTGTVAIINGGTGQTTAAAGFNALSPITTAGDLILGNGTNSATRLGIGANGYVLTSNGTTASWAAATGGVSQIVAGTNVTISPVGGTGVVTINASGSGGASAYTRTSFTATAGQTAFTVTYAVGYLQVYVNGVLLATSDYTATSGTGFTLGVACAAGDIVEALVITTSVTGVTTGKSIAMAMIFGF